MRTNSGNSVFGTAAAIAALALCATANADMGRTEGGWGVTPSGAATYTIPIWGQSGPKGLQPSLAFVYNSQSGNGTMGIGWSVSGFSSITRCPATLLEDGADKAVKVDAEDRFCLDGNKLRITSGPVTSYGSAGAVYQTGAEVFSRIVSVNTAGTGPESFLVYTKSGLILEYGNTSDSRIVLSGTTVFSWLLNKVRDRDGNSYAVTYTTDNAQGRVPRTVSWGPTTSGGSTYQYQAGFNYVDKVNVTDWVSSRQGTITLTLKPRLTSVTIGYSAGGSSYATRRQYQLEYNGGIGSPTSGRSRLTSITECAETTSNCLKPTTMTYQDGQQGVSSTATTVASVAGTSTGKFDFNGDGRSDLAFLSGTWKVALSTGAGFTAPIETGISATQPHFGRFVSTNADGILYGSGGVWNYAGYNGSSFTITSTGVPILGGNLSTASDADGDGLIDILHSATTLSGSTYNAYVYVRKNITTGTAAVPSFNSTTTIAFTTPVGPQNGAINFLQYDFCPGDRLCDINGDGAPDLYVLVTTTFGCGPSGCSASTSGYDLVSGGGYYTLVNSRAGVIAPHIGIQFNNDKCVDTIRANTTTLRVNSCGSGATSTVTLPAAYLTFMDWDGDGKSDEIVNNGGTIGVYKSTGSLTSPFSGLITTSIPYNSSCRYFPADVDADGLDELVCATNTNTIFYRHNGGGSVGSAGGTGVFITQVPDLLSNVTDGYGLSVSPSYVSIPQSNYTKGTGTQLPLVDATNIMYAVGRMRVSDGFTVSYDLEYSYKGARRNIKGTDLESTVGSDQAGNQSRIGWSGVFAGFEEISVVDSRTGIKSRTTYEQLFPLDRMVKKTEVLQSDGTPITTVTNTNLTEPLDSDPLNARYFNYISESVSNTYEVGGPLNGQLITTATTTFGYSPFTYGNLATSTTVVTDKDSTSTPSRNNSTWTTAITNTYEQPLTSGTDWCIGFVKEVQVVQSSTAAGVDPVTRTVGFSPDASAQSKCRVKTKTIEPSSEAYRASETYRFDSFGNVDRVDVVGRQPTVGGNFVDMPTRTTFIDWGTTGQFPISTTDPSGAVSTFAYYPETGMLKDAFDPNSTASNNIKSSYQYDGFARATKIMRPDGTYTTISYENCATSECVYPTHKLTLKETDHDDVGGVITDRFTYRDVFDRPFVTRARLLNGAAWNGSYQWNETEYDIHGRVSKKYVPCVSASASSSCRQQAVSNSYDLAGRLTQMSRPSSQSDSTPASTSYIYSGRTQTTVDAMSKSTVRVQNIDGSNRQILDANNFGINFAYDAAGSLVGITDTTGAPRLHTVTVRYGLRPFQIAATDSAHGASTRTFNSLGDLIAWTDANGNLFSATYDEVSRPLTRIEPGASTSWEWGNNPAAFNWGRLRHVESSANGVTYAEDYTYDSLTRLVAKIITIPGESVPFQYGYSYDSDKGWLDTLTYPASTSGYQFAVKHLYQNGALQSVVDANATSTIFWAANSSNAWGQLTQETFGNNIIRARSYDSVTARLSSIQSGPAGNSTSVQNLSYLYDLVGNVSQRQNNKLGLTETFFYAENGNNDPHRLDKSTLNSGSTTATNLQVTYDESGNILRKNEAGVSELPVNQTITWTSYNYPEEIEVGGESATFSYGPDRQRWKMVYNGIGGTETTLYIGALMEKVVTGGGAQVVFRHTIQSPGGAVAIYRRPSTGSPSVQYMLDDHQGSTEAFVEGGGAPITASFSAFGTRRNAATWSGDVTNRADLDAITRQGYTYQTVLGSMGLNHMNGRVQDAITGRFLSPDPYTTDPGNTQNYNRYSYVHNNPLSYTDPSGFDPCSSGFSANWGRQRLSEYVDWPDGTRTYSYEWYISSFSPLCTPSNVPTEQRPNTDTGNRGDGDGVEVQIPSSVCQAVVDKLREEGQKSLDEALPKKGNWKQINDGIGDWFDGMGWSLTMSASRNGWLNWLSPEFERQAHQIDRTIDEAFKVLDTYPTASNVALGTLASEFASRYELQIYARQGTNIGMTILVTSRTGMPGPVGVAGGIQGSVMTIQGNAYSAAFKVNQSAQPLDPATVALIMVAGGQGWSCQ